jgi:peptidoglycan/xylan/chitin deacetylase (PgdA/CDA1 family)
VVGSWRGRRNPDKTMESPSASPRLISPIVLSTIREMNPRLKIPLLRFPIRVLLICLSSIVPSRALEPIPDKLVVLTFDDSVASHHSVVRPLLKRYGFSATFFITEGFSFRTNKKDYMTWEQIAELHRDGFEIGNHTRDHMGVSRTNLDKLPEQIEAINARCAEHGIPRPTSFAFPGNAITPEALPILQRLGIRFARRGGAPEYPYEEGCGFAFEPGRDHPLLIPSAGDARPKWTLGDFKRAAQRAREGRIAVLQFHGVPDNDHPWVHTPPAMFETYLDYLHRNGYRVLALRDLARFVDPKATPAEPMAIIEKRKSDKAAMVLVRGEVVDGKTKKLVACRLYIRGEDGVWHFPDSASTNGNALSYQKRNLANTNVAEMHTTLSAHPFEIELPPGRYTFMAERGKEYFPERIDLTLSERATELDLKISLRRWIDMASRGWFSGDTHTHRDPAELPNSMLAEDVNVVFPMVYWTTDADVSPNQSTRNFKGNFTASPVNVDGTHVYYPLNTEYEIFSTAKRSHTLGALLAINHKTVLDLPALPVSKVAERAHAEGALLDLEKHNWPWSMAIVPLVQPDLFELANNHHWQTEFGVRNWAVPAPAWMKIGNGIGTERDWTLYGFLNYYALLDCGFRLRPTAGTANGVHPVPLAFSRVYVHLPRGFTYDGWVNGLKSGRTFVTTGPMLLATVNGEDPGHVFSSRTKGKQRFRVKGEIMSAEPVAMVEIIGNGEVIARSDTKGARVTSGAHQAKFDAKIEMDGSGWVAVRCWEERENGRFRFAHSAPWFVEVKDKPLRPRRDEAEFLVQRVEEEIARSGPLLPPAALEEYQRALRFYQELGRTAR